MAREVMTWFLQTKKIAKQNKLLIKQNQVLMDKIEAMSVKLNHIELFSPLTATSADIDEVNKRTNLVSDIDDPLIDIEEPSIESSFSKRSSLD